MKTDNFKMSFLTEFEGEKNRVTLYTFGCTMVIITLLESSNVYESFFFEYRNNGKTKLECCSDILPNYLAILVRNLYYGSLIYSNTGRFECSMQVISVIRSIQNYFKRTNLLPCVK